MCIRDRGEQEHDGDPFRNYLQQPMKPGWMISNEPGLYGEFRLQLNGKNYNEKIGIRIEDDVLVTQQGCEVLTENVPKEPDDIEKIMGQS